MRLDTPHQNEHQRPHYHISGDFYAFAALFELGNSLRKNVGQKAQIKTIFFETSKLENQ